MVHPTALAPTSPSFERLLERARALAPALIDLAETSERTCRLPREIDAAFHASGLYRSVQPRRVGGSGLGFTELLALTEEVSRHCASSGWLLGNLAAHHWMLGMFDPAAQDEIWNESPDAAIAAALSFPNGRATPVDGGIRLSGRWPYASGVHLSPWTMLAGVTPRPDGAPGDWLLAVVRTRDLVVHDDWDPIGLRATGSVDVQAQDLFVPTHRLLRPKAASGGPSPGSAVDPDPQFRVPMIVVAPYSLLGAAIGNARGVLESALAIVSGRATTNTAAPLAGIASIQRRLGQASGLVDAARAIVLSALHDIASASHREGAPPLADKLRWRRDCALAVHLCGDAVELAWSTVGAGGLARGTPIERGFRDSVAIRSSVVFNTELSDTAYGQVLLERPAAYPTF